MNPSEVVYNKLKEGHHKGEHGIPLLSGASPLCEHVFTLCLHIYSMCVHREVVPW